MVEPAMIYIDGASRGNPGPAGAGVIAVAAQGNALVRLSKYVGETTNNVAEYLALVYALLEACARGWRHVMIRTDSELVARQFTGQYHVRDGTLRLFHDLARHLAGHFERCTVEHVPREQNRQADRLAREAVKSRVASS